MKEAFKIGGYAWHAHKRFEEIKDGWDFLKTVEWLKTIGIRFSNDSLRRFVNVYATYQSAQVAKGSLTDSYVVVNQQAENLSQLPERKIEILGNLFRALPSDDSTNPKELIRELIRAARVFGVTERTIQRWKPESLKQKRLSQEEVLKIQELKEEGKSRREIANEIGVSHTAINKLETSDKCQKFPDPTPSYLEPDDPTEALPISEVLGSNIIKAPVEFKRAETLPDDDDDEEDLDIEAPDVEKLLVDPEWQLWSDRKIADKCAVSPSTVAKVRNDLSVQLGQMEPRSLSCPLGKIYL